MADTYISQIVVDSDSNIWYNGVYGSKWAAQTFTPTETFRASKLRIKCKYRWYEFASLHFQFFNVDGNGHPSGDAITSWSTVIPITDVLTWYEDTITPKIVFEAGVKYAVIFWIDEFSPNNIIIGYNKAGGLANGNMLLSYNAGNTWENITSCDLTFQITGTAPDPFVSTFFSPKDDATNIPVGIKLQWINGIYTDTVDVYLNKVEESATPVTKVVDNQNVTSFQPPDDLELDKEYVWKVVCKNAYGSTESGVQSFTTGLPIYIEDVAGLQAMNNNTAAIYILLNDIDASETAEWNDGEGFVPVGNFDDGYFSGALYGNGYTIDSLTVNMPYPTGSYKGSLFGIIGATGYVEKVHLTNVNITGHGYIGGFVGYNSGGIISTCSVTGSVYIDEDRGGDYIGGFVGYTSVSSGYIWRCWSEVNIIAEGELGNLFGGFVGFHNKGTIKDCYAIGDVPEPELNGKSGGFVGWGGNDAAIENCYSIGEVTGDGFFIGGFSGWLYGTATNCFWDKETSGQESGENAIDKTTAEMKKEETFIDWDFTFVWRIIEDETYPSFYPVKAKNPSPEDDEENVTPSLKKLQWEV